MECVAPLGPMYQAGTLSGNPLAVTAGLTTLRLLSKPGTYEHLETLGQRFEVGVRDILLKAGKTPIFNRIGAMFTSFFTDTEVCTLSDLDNVDTSLFSKYFHGLLERGVYFAPSQFECGFISLAHSENDIDKTLEQIEIVIKEITD